MRNLKRALSLTLASVMLLGMMVVGTSALSFKDSDQITNVTAAAVMQGIGVFEGDQNGNFLPNVTVTRAQMAAIVGKILYGSKLDAKQFVGTSKFTDVPGNHYANGYINLVASLGLMNGTSATTFTPDRTLTTAEAALLLCRALGYFQGNELTGNWAEDRLTAVSTATKLGLFKDLNLAIDAPLNRDNVAAMTFNTITEAVPVMYNTNFDIYYTDSTSWVSGVNYNWTDTLGYKNFSLAYQLDKDESNRPTTVWGIGKVLLSDTNANGDGRIRTTYKGITKDDEIIEVANDTAYVYTGKLTFKTLYNDLGKTLVEDYTWSVSVNGTSATATSIADGKGYKELNDKKTSGDAMHNTATGVLTEVFVDTANKKIDMTVTDTYVAKVTKVKADGNQYEITVRYESAGTTGLDKTVKVDSTDLKADDIVLITVHGTEIETIELAEIVEGEITAIKGTDYVKLDGTQHDKAKNYKNIGAGNTSMPGINTKAKLYLDKNGNMIAADAQGITVDDYLYVKDDAKTLGGLSAEAVFSDGTTKEIKISKINSTESFSGGEAKGKVFTFTEEDGKYTLTDPTTKLGVGTGTNGATKKGSAIVTMSNGSGSTTTATATNKTVFVDVDGGKVYEGYANVPTFSNATNIGAAKDGKAVIIFITKGDVSESESFWFYVKSDSAETSKVGSTTYSTYTVYTKDGENKEFITKNMTASANISDNDSALLKNTIYKAKSMDADGRLTSFDESASKTVTGLAHNATGNVTAKGDGVLTLDANTNDLTGGSHTTFTYNSETVFIVAKGDKNGDTDSVDVVTGSDGDIGTKTNTTQSKSTVYILNVKDKNDDTPLATLVLVVNAADAPASGGGQNPGTALSVSTQPESKKYFEGAEIADLTVAATGGTVGAGYQYQWEKSTDSGANWSNVTGATAATLDMSGAGVAPTAGTNAQYRCKVTDRAGTPATVTSDAATIEVKACKITWPTDSAAGGEAANTKKQITVVVADATIKAKSEQKTATAAGVEAEKTLTTNVAADIYTITAGDNGTITITVTVTQTGYETLTATKDVAVEAS